MTAFYDARLGPLEFLTVHDDLKEALGDGLEAVGAALIAAERKPRPFGLSLPVRGARQETDPAAAGERLRRQVRGLVENPAARLEGLYLQLDFDPDLDCWLLVGGADLEYDEGRGPTFGDYKLTLTDCYRVGGPRTHRPARRLAAVDRRLSTTARDRRGTLFSTDFAAQTILRRHRLPVGATDVVSEHDEPVTPTTVPGRYGLEPLIDGRVHGEVVDFEHAEAEHDKGDVAVRDRRPGGLINLVPNPSSETGALSTSFSASSGGQPAATFAQTAAWAKAGTKSTLHDVWRTDNNTLIAGTPSGTSGFAVTPGRWYAARLTRRWLLMETQVLTVAARIYWMKADGTPSTVSANTSGPFVSTDAAGTEGDRWVIGQAPSDAAFGVVRLTYQTNNLTGLGKHYQVYMDAFGAWDLGTATPASSGVTTEDGDVPAYFDGDSEGADWTGPAHASTSVHGWEAVYGPDHQLTDGDVPILQNGRCRVRWVPDRTSFAVESWDGTAMVEVGRVAALDHTAGARYTTLLDASVVEWTRERAVIRVVLSAGSARRGELYITLQRGWPGPRFELYGRNGATTPQVRLRVTAPIAGATTLGKSSGTATITAGGNTGTFAAIEPWAYMLPPSPARPISMAVLQAQASTLGADDTTAYGTSQKAIEILSPATGLQGYLSVTLGAGDRGSESTDAQTLGRVNLIDARAEAALVTRT